MKLSDFGLCKPLDCSTLSTLHENEPSIDEEYREPMDIEQRLQSSAAGTTPWRTQQEQLQHWQRNRRTLVSSLLRNSLQIVYLLYFFLLHAWPRPLTCYFTVVTREYAGQFGSLYRSSISKCWTTRPGARVLLGFAAVDNFTMSFSCIFTSCSSYGTRIVSKH
jgi:hypothetical protein